MLLSTPRIVIAGLSGDSGKTMVALGLARALTGRGLTVSPFKKGPDYIDAAWLGAATGLPGRHLDTYLMPPEALGESLRRGSAADLLLVEGNRGLFDGFDADGTHSTAELAKLLAAPVVLVVDVTKMTRTVAALVMGCRVLDPDVNLAGVVLNRVGTARQERVIREAIRRSYGPPVLGAIPRIEDDPLPGRHLGLVTAAEHPRREEAIRRSTELVGAHVDLDTVIDTGRTAPPVSLPDRDPLRAGPAVRLGVFRDEALSFYYPGNLEALEEVGATLIDVSPLHERTLPEVDGLYFGGGFPEVHVERLAGNHEMRDAVRTAAAAGMPIYAECGGLMYLAKELIVDGASYPMTGVLDLVVEQTARPQGHGYVDAEVDRPNPFFEPGSRLRGHEFHYSRVVAGRDVGASTLRLHRGMGVGAARDGLVQGRIWASYMHLHALGVPSWVDSFVSLARTYQAERGHAAPGGRDSGEESSHDANDHKGEEEAEKEDGSRHGMEQGGQGVAAAGT
jgi:cobyrinic acid a,c-diamide synthase